MFLRGLSFATRVLTRLARARAGSFRSFAEANAWPMVSFEEFKIFLSQGDGDEGRRGVGDEKEGEAKEGDAKEEEKE